MLAGLEQGLALDPIGRRPKLRRDTPLVVAVEPATTVRLESVAVRRLSW